MKTIFRPGVMAILRTLYESRNRPLHLREIARRSHLNESSVSRNLHQLTDEAILLSEKDANLVRFWCAPGTVPRVFPFFDDGRRSSLPLLRRKAIKAYIDGCPERPWCIVVFGSTAKGTFRESSDLDLLVISEGHIDDRKLTRTIEAETGIAVHTFQDGDILESAVATGFPVQGHEYYYEVLYEGRRPDAVAGIRGGGRALSSAVPHEKGASPPGHRPHRSAKPRQESQAQPPLRR